MSATLEEMLRIARAATKGPWVRGTHVKFRVFSNNRTVAQLFDISDVDFVATFNPRTAEALVKVAMAATRMIDVGSYDTPESDAAWVGVDAAVGNLTAAMASEDGQSPAEGLSEPKASEEEAPDATR